MRTYSRADWMRAETLWGDSPEWDAVRRQAAGRGILFPPRGTRWDSWDDDSPSQRAMLIRAIRETPTLLASCIARSSTWSEAIGQLIVARDDLRATTRPDSEPADPDRHTALLSVAEILERVPR